MVRTLKELWLEWTHGIEGSKLAKDFTSAEHGWVKCDQGKIDAGPGMEVPGDSTSQGRDLVNVSGHAIPAVPYGNQYAVLYDTEPTEMEDLDGF